MGLMDFSDFLSATHDKKNPIDVTTVMPQHPTGFMYLDSGCGSYMNVYAENEKPLYTYHNIGFTSGSVNSLLSKSQGGKTTLAIEMANAIIEPYINPRYYQRFIKENSTPKDKEAVMRGMPFIQIADTEKTLPLDYVKKLIHCSNKQLKARVIINPITTDKDLIRLIEGHIKYKVEYMTPTVNPMLDIFGKPIYEYPPTCLIIDSTSQLILEDVDDPTKIDSKKDGLAAAYDAATKGPAGAQRAKVISALYSQMVNYAKRYNIIIFSINHINKMPAIMGIPVKQYRGLRAGETIGGGERALYLSASMLRLDVIKSIGYNTSTSVNLGDGITGHIANASWIKSKTNSKANTCQLAFTNINGYDPLLSSLWFGKEKGDLAKKGNFYYVNGHPDLPFTLKNYTEVFGEHPELFSAYYDQLREQCEPMLDNPDVALKNEKKLMKDLRDDIHEDYQNGEYDRNTANDLDDIFSQMVND